MLKQKLIIVFLALFIGAWIGSTTGQSYANSVPVSLGTVNDPLITKSYLDQQLAVLVATELGKQSQNSTKPSQESASGAELKVVQLQSGQTLFAKAGAEVIVRTGKTVAVSTDGDGIPDVTSGNDLAAGTGIELNHLLIFPRDGRGVKPAPKNEGQIFVMVRGGYTIQSADRSVQP